ncbi:MAG TPA: RNA polymerase sigma factor [Ignavibacteria bacterium]|jgi:RNA polymerase sigma factor (sigma-70 family)
MELAYKIQLDKVKEQNDTIAKAFSKEEGRLKKFVRSRVARAEDAEDIIQDVFYQFSSVMRFEPIEKAASWLFNAASNKVIDWYRKFKPQSLDALNEYKEFTGAQIEDILSDENEEPDSIYLRESLWPMLEEVLDELPENQREVFIMNVLDDKSFNEIAESTGEKVNTLISRKRYAVLYLRERLREFYEDFLNN